MAQKIRFSEFISLRGIAHANMSCAFESIAERARTFMAALNALEHMSELRDKDGWFLNDESNRIILINIDMTLSSKDTWIGTALLKQTGWEPCIMPENEEEEVENI